MGGIYISRYFCSVTEFLSVSSDIDLVWKPRSFDFRSFDCREKSSSTINVCLQGLIIFLPVFNGSMIMHTFFEALWFTCFFLICIARYLMIPSSVTCWIVSAGVSSFLCLSCKSILLVLGVCVIIRNLMSIDFEKPCQLFFFCIPFFL